MDEQKLRNTLLVHKALFEALINRLVQLEGILSRTDGVTALDHEILTSLLAHTACGKTPLGASPDGALLHFPRSFDDGEILSSQISDPPAPQP